MEITFNLLLQVFYKLFAEHKASSLDEIQKKYAPFAVGLNNDGIILPTSEIIRGNAGVDRWCDMMEFYNMSHLKYWFNLCNKYEADMLMSDFLAAIGPYGCQEHMLPFIEYVPRPEQVLIQQGTMLDLIQLYNMATVGDFGTYIYCVVIMGIFINDYLAGDVLQIQNPQEFIAARLFQGELDGVLARGQDSSSFVPVFGSAQNTYSSEPFYQNISGEISGEAFNRLVANEVQVIKRSTFLGNEIPQVIAMKDALRLSDSYVKYLEERGPISMQKVSPHVYESISLGSSTRKELIWKGWDRREVRQPTKWMKPPPAFAEHGVVDFSERHNPNFMEQVPKTVVGSKKAVFDSVSAPAGDYGDLRIF